MWDHLKNIPPILLGQSIFAFIDLKSIVRLETALVSSEPSQTFRSFLSYITEANIKVQIPQGMTKMHWLQTHDFPITKVVVHLDKINATFETKMIHEIELVDNDCTINNDALEYLPNSCFLKVVSVYFDKTQDFSLMVELFPRLYNLRELHVRCRPDGWILSALQALHKATNNNIMIENICIHSYDIHVGSVAEIVQYCPRLQSLRVTFRITEDSLLALSKYCPLLKEVDSFCIPRISTPESAVLCAPALSCIHSITTYIKHLENFTYNYTLAIPYMTELRHVSANGSIDHILLPIVSQYCLKVESLEFQLASSATPTEVLQLTRNCRNLRRITIYSVNLCVDEVVIELAQYCPNLEYLTLVSPKEVNTAITANSLLALSKHCLKLDTLNIIRCLQITEAGVLQFIHNSKHLNRLRLPLNCLSDDTVLSLPVTVSNNNDGMTLIFNT